MIISSFYNEKEKILMITTTIEAVDKKVIKEQDVVKIYNENDELIGVNFLNFESPNLEQGIVNLSSVDSLVSKYFGEDIKPAYIVGEITSIEKHPKSEKLNVCQVNLGDYTEQIVCGASNVQEGIKVIVSRVGAVMPNGMEIKESKLINVQSNGMITSYKELGIKSSQETGIAILNEDYKVGEPFEI